MRRRTFLASAAGGFAAFAGCLSTGGEQAGDDTPTGPPETPTETPPPSETPTPGPGLTRTPTDPGGSPTDPGGSPTASPGDSETPTPKERIGYDIPTATGEPSQPGDIDSAWPLPASDAGFTNRTAVPGPTDPVAELWSVEAGTGLSEPVLADGTVYVAGRDGTVLTLDGRDGTEQWRRSVGDLAAAPSVVGGRVFVATGDGLVALAASDGSVQWRVETPERADFVDPAGRLVDAAVMVHEGGIYTVAGEDSPAVVRRSLADGSEDWRTEIAEPWALPIFASGEGEVFVSSGPHDTRFWQLDAATGDLLAEEPRYGHDFPTEAFYADGSVYTVEPFFGSAGRTPLDEGTGWTTDVPPGGELADGDGRVYYATSADDAGVFALSKTDGAIDWEVEPPGDVVGRPVAASDVVVVPTDAGLYGVAPSDGSDRWLRPGDATGEDVLVADDLVFSTREGAVRAFRAP